MDQSYEGFYAQFDTPSKKVGSMFMGADDLVGDDYQLEPMVEDGKTVIWLKNKFGSERGFLDSEGSRRVQLAFARGQKVRALLSFVAYTDSPDPGHYWGEMAIFCFNPAYSEEMDAYIDRVANLMADGARPDIDLGSSAVEKIFKDPNWVPTGKVALPKKEKGMAILKDHRSLSEKMVEQGRARNKGCYVVSWLFIIVVVALIVIGGLHLFGVL